MRVEELEPYLHEHWQTIREQLLAGTYRPSAVKRLAELELLQSEHVGTSTACQPVGCAAANAAAAQHDVVIVVLLHGINLLFLNFHQVMAALNNFIIGLVTRL
jgi:hypothetical protein